MRKLAQVASIHLIFIASFVCLSEASGATINIDSAWLSSRTAPYTLDGAGNTYVLQTDVTTEAGAFQILSDGITFDLNGHTITYDNFANTGLANGGMESCASGIPTGWDFSNAPNASCRSTTHFALDGHYYLEFEDPTAGEYIVSSWTTLPANSEAVAYFIRGDGTWTYNSEYNPNPVPAPMIRLEVEFEDGSTVFSTEFDGGAQEFTFTTKATEGLYRMRLTIVSFSGRGQYGDIPRFDLLDLRPTGNTGISARNKQDVSIRNGQLIQGAGGGHDSPALDIYATSNTLIDEMAVETSGMKSYIITASYINNTEIRNSQFDNHTRAVFNRHQIGTAVNIGSSSGLNFHHTEVNAATGLACVKLGGGQGNRIHHSVLRTQTVYTNHHAIVAIGSDNGEIDNNRIETLHGQGILVSIGGNNIDVHDNFISLHGTRPNHEYGLYSHDAIRLNDYGAGTLSSIKVRNNEITLTGGLDPHYETGYGNSTKVINGIMNGATGSDIEISGNRIVINLDYDPKAVGSCFELGNKTGLSSHVFFNNYCESNSKNVVIGGYSAATYNLNFLSNTLVKRMPTAGEYHTLFTRGGHIENSHFVDTTLLGGASLETAYLSTSEPSGKSYNFFVDWYLDLGVRDSSGVALSGANVSIKDATGTEVFSGTTDSLGNIETTRLTQYRRYGARFNNEPKGFDDKTPHSFSISKAGHEIKTFSLEMDQSKEISLALAQTGEVGCMPLWECTQWGFCQNGNQTRSCIDANNCGSNVGKLPEERACVAPRIPDLPPPPGPLATAPTNPGDGTSDTTQGQSASVSSGCQVSSTSDASKIPSWITLLIASMLLLSVSVRTSDRKEE